MNEMPQSTVEIVQQEIAALREGLGRLTGTLTKQRAVIQQIRTSHGVRGLERPLQDLLAFASAAASMAQELETRLPQFDQELARLQDNLAARTKEHEQLSALYEVSRVINSTLDLEEVLKQVMDTIIELTGAERGFLMLIDDETGELEFKVAREMDRKTIDDSSFQISRTIVRQVASDGVPIVTTNAQADPRFRAQESVVSYSLRSILCVPLRARAMMNNTRAYAWVYHPRVTQSLDPPIEVQGARLDLPDMEKGRYRIVFWDTYQARPLATRDLDHPGGTLTLRLPPFRNDLAIKAKRR